jgi:hypothetical protein
VRHVEYMPQHSPASAIRPRRYPFDPLPSDVPQSLALRA